MSNSETCANPLLLGWIKEWLEQARERNTKGVTVYKKAYESMKACPLVFQHPSEAQQLNGLGPKLCERLTDKLKDYCNENGLPMPEDPRTVKASKRKSDGADDSQPAKKTRKPKTYAPALRSGPYALILALGNLDENSNQSMTKAQLIEQAQPYCDTSFTAPSDPTKSFTAWNSMKTLLTKELVYTQGHPLKKYSLTEEGWEVAKAIKKTAQKSNQSTLSFGSREPTANDPRTTQRGNLPDYRDIDTEAGLLPQSRSNDLPTQTIFDEDTADSTPSPIPIPPNSFTVQLILDTREVRTSKDRDYISNELIRKGITPEVRALEVGDTMWVAKFHDPLFLRQYGEEGDEVMLDWIVERKRLDDLIGSIKDGRFHEQKFRLRRSGIKNVIYLIEEFAITHESNAAAAQKYNDMVASAIAQTEVVNGYFVKRTKNLDDTIRYLARMTFLLRNMYNTSPSPSSSPSQATHTLSLLSTRNLSISPTYQQTLSTLRTRNPTTTYGVTFPTFCAIASKSEALTLRDIFLKMLMCTRGVSGDKALEIQRQWATPQAFIRAFEALGEKERETMVADRMTHLMVGRKKIAKVLSKKIAEVWGMEAA
ncbi:crossover junction endonuclease MUS81 [Aspergillus undulatus]|uniref:crossover junction endonuclease MUS81 n=1 Tax=Aspergillus undulatus TaxID=1810928 RepID=UPI003CCDD0E9